MQKNNIDGLEKNSPDMNQLFIVVCTMLFLVDDSKYINSIIG